MQDRKGNLSSHKKIDRKALAKRRQDAMGLYRKGLTQYRIAKKIGVSFEAVSNWVKAYKSNGTKGLESLGNPGPKMQFLGKGKQKDKASITKQSRLSSRKKGSKLFPTALGRLFNLFGSG